MEDFQEWKNAFTVIGGKLATAVATGPAAVPLGIIAGLSGAGAVWYLGTHRKFY